MGMFRTGTFERQGGSAEDDVADDGQGCEHGAYEALEGNESEARSDVEFGHAAGGVEE